MFCQTKNHHKTIDINGVGTFITERKCGNRMRKQNIDLSHVCFTLDAINLGHWEVGILATRGEHQSVAAHEGDGQSSKQLAYHFSLFRPLAVQGPCTYPRLI